MTMPKELSSLIKEGNFNPSQVEVVEDGKNVMRPEVMNFLMLASIASQAVRVRKYFDDRTSEGLVQNFDLVVTPVAQDIKCDFPSQTFYLFNYGPSTIFVEINRRFTTARRLLINENMFIDFETHKLERFYVYTVPGGAATASGFAKR